MKTVKEKIQYLLKNKPEEVIAILEKWAEKMPEQANMALSLAIYGKHILSEEMYDDIMKCLAVKPYYDYDVLKEPETSHIDFSKEDFSEYDFMYAINRLHMQFHDIIDKLEEYVAMAERYLKDSNYPGKAGERAYDEAYKILEQHDKV